MTHLRQLLLKNLLNHECEFLFVHGDESKSGSYREELVGMVREYQSDSKVVKRIKNKTDKPQGREAQSTDIFVLIKRTNPEGREAQSTNSKQRIY